MTIEEVEAALRAHGEEKLAEARRDWEIMRLQTYMTLSPFCQKLPAPQEFLPFTWDGEDGGDSAQESPMTEEERKDRERRHRESLGW